MDFSGVWNKNFSSSFTSCHFNRSIYRNFPILHLTFNYLTYSSWSWGCNDKGISAHTQTCSCATPARSVKSPRSKSCYILQQFALSCIVGYYTVRYEPVDLRYFDIKHVHELL